MFEEVEEDDEEGNNEVEGKGVGSFQDIPGSPKESPPQQVLASSTTISGGSAPSAEAGGVGKAAEAKERLLTLAKVEITMSLFYAFRVLCATKRRYYVYGYHHGSTPSKPG